MINENHFTDTIQLEHSMKIQHLSPSIGSIIHNFDCGQSLTHSALTELRKIWLERKLIVLREQTLSSEQYLAFARQLGTPDIYPFLKGLEGFPEIIPARTRYEGYKTLVTGKGLGYLRPNTVMLGWPNNIRGSTNICNEPYMSDTDEMEFCSLLEYVALAKKTLLICKGSAEFPSSGPASEHERAGILADTSPKNRLISTLRTMSTQMDSPEIMYGFIDVW